MQTKTLPHEKAENYDLSELSARDGLMLRQTHNDGSQSTFSLTDKYPITVVRCGRETTVMLKKELNDGSHLTQSVATEFYEEHKSKFAEYVSNPQ